MYFLYNLLLTSLAIIFSPIIFILFGIKPKLRAGFFEKIGFYKKNSLKNKVIWIHAVSVGEVNAVEGFIKQLKLNFPNHSLILSTVTRTGNAVAKTKLGNVVDKIIYFPYDFCFSVKSAIKAVDPEVVIIAETEIWPNFSKYLHKNNIPLVVVNGRISPNSHKNYKKFNFFFKRVLDNYALILMQTDGDRQRIVEIGANPDKTLTMGNLKFDISNILDETDINSLKNELALNKNRLILAGSTHQGEDEIIIEAYKKLKADFHDLKLLIAPRHPERNSHVMKLISSTGFKFGVRSKNSSFNNADIILLDTMGELGKLYSVATIAFVGGSFSGTGGHNPLEPAIYGVPVVSGSTVFNFKDIYKYMTETNSALLASNQEELYMNMKELLSSPDKYSAMSNACKKIFETNKGAADFAINKLKKFCEST